MKKISAHIPSVVGIIVSIAFIWVSWHFFKMQILSCKSHVEDVCDNGFEYIFLFMLIVAVFILGFFLDQALFHGRIFPKNSSFDEEKWGKMRQGCIQGLIICCITLAIPKKGNFLNYTNLEGIFLLVLMILMIHLKEKENQ